MIKMHSFYAFLSKLLFLHKKSARLYSSLHHHGFKNYNLSQAQHDHQSPVYSDHAHPIYNQIQ